MTYAVGIVGAGVVGLAHAWLAAERGFRVSLFERSHWARSASVRNFGIVLPVSQIPSVRPWALASRQRWLTLAREAGLWVNRCGSIHLAHRADEWQVLVEYQNLLAGSELGRQMRLAEPQQCARLAPALRTEDLLGGLVSDWELCVHPTEAIRRLPQWLAERFNVQLHFQSTVTQVESGRLVTSNGHQYGFDWIVICSGDELSLLFPDHWQRHAVRPCKLHMMRTVAQPAGWQVGPVLIGGLALRQYAAFRACPSQGALAARVAREAPELDRFGIHLIVSQDDHGRVLLGDSHEYGAPYEPFHSTEIDRLIIRELRRMIDLPCWELESRWTGTYLKHGDQSVCQFSPLPGVQVCSGLGGSGMTLAFGLAEENWNQWIGQRQ